MALAACAHARKPEVALPAAFEAPQAPPAGAVALDRWWTSFNDPQLDALVDGALAANPDARSAAARLREARATGLSGLTAFLPQGDANGSTKHTHTTQLAGTALNFPGFNTNGTSETTTANLNVSWELDVFGRVFATARAARGDIAAARFDYEATRASLAAQTADSYFNVRGLSIQLADARESARIERELYDTAVKKARAGLGSTADADRMAGDLANAQSQAMGLEAELAANKRLLLILAGRTTAPTASVFATPLVDQAPAVPATLPAQLLTRRPDVREAQARIVAASGRLLFDDLAFLPNFVLTPGIGWSKIVQPGFSSTTRNWSIGGSVTQPVFSIPKLLADLKAQDARTDEAVIAYEKSVQTAFGEAEGALVRLDADRRRVAVLTEGESRAARAYDAARIGYQRGLTDLQTALTAEQAWRNTRTQLTSAQVAQLRQSVTAFKAIGGGWPGAAATGQGAGK